MDFEPVWMSKDDLRKQALTAEVKAELEANGWTAESEDKPVRGRRRKDEEAE